MNPFPYHEPVTGAELCGREAALDTLVRAARAGSRTAAVVGPAGHGVSSLAREAAARLRSAAAVRLALVELARLADGEDLPEWLPPPAPDAGPGGASPRRILLVDDADLLDGDGPRARAADRLAASAAGGSLLLFGHDRPALEGLAGPDAAVLELGPLPLAAWLPHALERFLATDVWVGNEHVEEAYRAVDGHPRHLQHVSHELWELAVTAGRRVEDGMVDEAVGRAAGAEARVWRVLWAGLTGNQRRFLRGVARAGAEAHPFGREFLEAAGLTTASSAQRAAASLRERGLLSETGSALRVADPLLARWLAPEAGPGPARPAS